MQNASTSVAISGSPVNAIPPVGNPDRRAWYREIYLRSSHWRAIRVEKLKAQPRCESCNKSGRLDIHHLSYERLYGELMSDLQALCRSCHNKEHGVVPSVPQKVVVKKDLKPGWRKDKRKQRKAWNQKTNHPSGLNRRQRNRKMSKAVAQCSDFLPNSEGLFDLSSSRDFSVFVTVKVYSIGKRKPLRFLEPIRGLEKKVKYYRVIWFWRRSTVPTS